MKTLLSSLLTLALVGCAGSSLTKSKNDRMAEIYFDAGTEALYAGRHAEALSSLLQATKLKPNYPEALNNMGLVYVQKNQMDKAEQSLKKALSIKEEYSEARNNLGSLYFRLKRYKEAEVEFKKVIEDLIYEKAFQANYNLGLVFEKTGRPLQAEQQYNLAVQGDATYCPAWYKLGKIQKERGDIMQAEASLKKSVSGVCYNNPEAQYDIATIYLKKNDVSKAKSKLLEVIEFFPQSEWAKRAEVTLNMIR